MMVVVPSLVSERQVKQCQRLIPRLRHPVSQVCSHVLNDLAIIRVIDQFAHFMGIAGQVVQFVAIRAVVTVFELPVSQRSLRDGRTVDAAELGHDRVRPIGGSAVDKTQ